MLVFLRVAFFIDMNTHKIKKWSSWVLAGAAAIAPIKDLIEFGTFNLNSSFLNSHYFKALVIFVTLYALVFFILPIIKKVLYSKSRIYQYSSYIVIGVSFILLSIAFWKTHFQNTASQPVARNHTHSGTVNGVILNGDNIGTVNVYTNKAISRFIRDEDIRRVISFIPALDTEVLLECKSDISVDRSYRDELRKRLVILGYSNVKSIDIGDTNRFFDTVPYSVKTIGSPVKQVIITINPQA